ncbi:hypothetical protein V1477_010256 [Vespula maculifrons]|uniref:Uncharacterized protein n=4 Tax=Vespula TaxID=7451 RepID=A0A834NUM3_VESGE|nr:hypothetical protein HZH66_000825 [Vespula vulgaris]KAF7418242.1 hypothetical protein HZH68_000895 [Vespula germanica]KAF7438575.1 hypothetical protein H0235_000966 [Vespula pensylvanica]
MAFQLEAPMLHTSLATAYTTAGGAHMLKTYSRVNICLNPPLHVVHRQLLTLSSCKLVDAFGKLRTAFSRSVYERRRFIVPTSDIPSMESTTLRNAECEKLKSHQRAIIVPSVTLATPQKLNNL